MNIRRVIDFYNEEYKQQAQNNNYQSIASAVDGLKPTARKVIRTILRTNDNKFHRVEVLANKTAGETEYLGGSTNISGVIVTISRGYITSNNIPLLETSGNFGQRLDNNAGEARYIEARKSKMLEKMFIKEDSEILEEQEFQEVKIEPRFYVPTLPLLLINGSIGVGTGHAQNIMPRNPYYIREYIIRYLDNGFNSKEDSKLLEPYWHGFKGDLIIKNDKTVSMGIIKGTPNKNEVEIIELPIGYNLESYTNKLITMKNNREIKGFDDLSDTIEDSFHFIIRTNKDYSKFFRDGMKDDIIKNEIFDNLKLKTNHNPDNYTSIIGNNMIKKFHSIENLIEYYIGVKLDYISRRRTNIISKKRKEILKLTSKKEFINLIVNKELIIANKSKKVITAKLSIIKNIAVLDEYKYLLDMPLGDLTKDNLNILMSNIASKKEYLKEYLDITEKDMWKKELLDLDLDEYNCS